MERHLAGYTGLLQVDGWGAYNRLAESKRPGGPLTLAACWAHLRRKFYELHVAGISHVVAKTEFGAKSPRSAAQLVRNARP